MWPLLLGMLGWQALVLYGEGKERWRAYESARAYADGVGKPLLVVGGRWGANPLRRLLRIPAHGCGDICLDTEEHACTGCPAFIAADIRDIPLPDKYAGAALASHVLEHLPTIEDAQKAIAELHRVADAVYIVSPFKQDILAWLIPEHHLWVEQRPDGSVFLEQRDS